MDVYSLNPQVLPGKPLSEPEHRKITIIFVVVLIIAIIAGATAWITLSKPAPKQATPVDAEAQLKAQVSALLNQPPVQATPEEIDRVTSLLSKSSSAPKAPSESEKQQIQQLLK